VLRLFGLTVPLILAVVEVIFVVEFVVTVGNKVDCLLWKTPLRSVPAKRYPLELKAKLRTCKSGIPVLAADQLLPLFV